MGQPSIVSLQARIDSLTSDETETSITSALDASPPALILDFSEVTFVSSMGLRVFLMAAKRCRAQNARLALHSVAPQIVTLFRLSGLTTFFPVYATRNDALAAVI